MFTFFKKMYAKKEKAIIEKISQLEAPLEKIKIVPLLNENLEIVHTLFSDMDIIRYKEIKTGGEKPLRCFLIFCEGMVNQEIINNNIIKPLMLLTPGKKDFLMNTLLTSVIQVGEAKTTDNFKSVVKGVASGDSILFIEGCSEAAVFSTKQFDLRSISEPDNEKTLVGPREGFTESLVRNISQITRRVHTNQLKTKILHVGQRTDTCVGVCYIESLVDKNVLSDLIERINGINIDGILDSNYITEIIRDHRYSMFRTTGYTERPDVVVGKLLEGRIAIFVDGSPMVLTVPYLFIENFQSSEDYFFSFYYTTFARLLRMCAFCLTVSVPGIYIASVAFSQEMLPLQLLIRLAIERQNVPLPAAIEAMIMLLVFDILRETGIRMPSSIGQTLSIVGALVIGQSAVEASLVAAPMIIMVATTGITSLLVPKLNAPIIFWRFFLLLMASMFGFFGLTIGISLLVIHVNNLSSFGVEHTSLKGSFLFQDFKDIFIRAPWQKMVERPNVLSENKTRQTGGNNNG